jgi:predicted aspartyl protease
MKKVHALTHSSDIILNCIKTPVVLKNTFTDVEIRTLGIWDTGATNSVITKNTANSLGLVALSKAVVNGVHGAKEVNVYYVNITLNNDQITINAQVTECEELSSTNDTGFLIGMNIISMGDFAITNFDGSTIMTFRVPSQQRIDFVRGIKESKPIVKDKIPGRNDPCNCGSGKKYKNCHGRNDIG